MGFFLRKSINLGKYLKLNLSKSGFGLSFGIKGLRAGKTPTGKSYIHAGRGGLYYRKQFSNKKNVKEEQSIDAIENQETIQDTPESKINYRSDISFEDYKRYKTASKHALAVIIPSLFLFLLCKINPFLLIIPISGIIVGLYIHSKVISEFDGKIDYFAELDRRNNDQEIKDEKVFDELQKIILALHKERQNKIKYKDYEYSNQ